MLDAWTADTEIVVASLDGKPQTPKLGDRSPSDKIEDGQATEAANRRETKKPDEIIQLYRRNVIFRLTYAAALATLVSSVSST